MPGLIITHDFLKLVNCTVNTVPTEKLLVFLLQAVIVCIRNREFDKASAILKRYMGKDPRVQVSPHLTVGWMRTVGYVLRDVTGLVTPAAGLKGFPEKRAPGVNVKKRRVGGMKRKVNPQR